jgi:high-affinity Fe2+/Pb2+ permease
MKQGLTLIVVVVMMMIFGTIMLVKLDTWEKKIKAEVLVMVNQACPEPSAEKNSQ